jgi:hypothetical protein
VLHGWIGLAVFARQQGVKEKTMRRWALALQHEHGDLLRSRHRQGKPRKYWVHPERLRAALEEDPEAKTAERDLIVSELQDLRQKVEALKKAHKVTKAQVNQLSLDFNQRPSTAIVGHESPHSL